MRFYGCAYRFTVLLELVSMLQVRSCTYLPLSPIARIVHGFFKDCVHDSGYWDQHTVDYPDSGAEVLLGANLSGNKQYTRVTHTRAILDGRTLYILNLV